MSAASPPNKNMGTPGFCQDCPYWSNPAVEEFGKCRRFPPTPMVGGFVLPTTPANGWCGEHPYRQYEFSLPSGFSHRQDAQDTPRAKAQPGPAIRPAPAKGKSAAKRARAA